MSSGNKPPARIVVDTNLFYSGVIRSTGIPFELLEQWRLGAFTLVLSDTLAEEYTRVLKRPELAGYGVTAEHIEALIGAIFALSEHVNPIDSLPIAVRDLKDEMVLAAALGSNAQYLITGDKDLLELKDNPHLGTLTILTAREFVDLLAQH